MQLITTETPIGKVDPSKMDTEYRAARLAASARGKSYFREWIKDHPTPASAKVKTERMDARTRAWYAARKVTHATKIETPKTQEWDSSAKTIASAFKPATKPTAKPRDPRLPAIGTTLTREYKGKTIRVKLTAEGFEWKGKEYSSLSRLASEITGAPSINGFLWFGLTKRS